MRLRALAVFERVIHQCVVIDAVRPDRPVLEVDAILRDGDADGALLLPVPTFMALAGGPDAAEPALRSLHRAGRIVVHDDLAHLTFPMWGELGSDSDIPVP